MSNNVNLFDENVFDLVTTEIDAQIDARRRAQENHPYGNVPLTEHDKAYEKLIRVYGLKDRTPFIEEYRRAMEVAGFGGKLNVPKTSPEEEYWQQKVPMEEIPKWYLKLSDTTEDEIKYMLSLNRQEFKNYFTVRMESPKRSMEAIKIINAKKSSDDSVFDLMDDATKKLDIKRLEGVNEYK